MEKEQFQLLAEQHRDMVYRIALNFHGSVADAEDTMQEVLLKLYLREEPFDTSEHAKRWLIRVTLNQCRSLWRSPWRKVELGELRAAVSFSQPEESELFEVVMSLPEQHRVALYLFYYEELSVREMARALGISETAVTSRLSRARAALKKRWNKEGSNGF